MRDKDRVRLRHMLDAARDAAAFVHGTARGNLDADRKLVLAVVKSVEIIGEAASQVSSEGQAEHPELPWRDMIAMRHRLIHGYYDINLDIVWNTVQEDVPPLIRALEAALASGPSS